MLFVLQRRFCIQFCSFWRKYRCLCINTYNKLYNPETKANVQLSSCQHSHAETRCRQTTLTFQLEQIHPLSTNFAFEKMSLAPLTKLSQVKLYFFWAPRQTHTGGEIKGQTSRALKKSCEKKTNPNLEYCFTAVMWRDMQYTLSLLQRGCCE